MIVTVSRAAGARGSGCRVRTSVCVPERGAVVAERLPEAPCRRRTPARQAGADGAPGGGSRGPDRHGPVVRRPARVRVERRIRRRCRARGSALPPGRRRRAGARPVVGPVVGAGELVEREDLPDPLAEPDDDDVDLRAQAAVAAGIGPRGLDPPVPVLPLLPCEVEVHVRQYSSRVGPERRAPPRGCGRRARSPGARARTRRARAGTSARRCASSRRSRRRARAAARAAPPARGEALPERRRPRPPRAPALDAARGLEPRDRRDEVRARELELRRERLPGRVERRLLGHRRAGRTGSARRRGGTRAGARPSWRATTPSSSHRVQPLVRACARRRCRGR